MDSKRLLVLRIKEPAEGVFFSFYNYVQSIHL